jgi:endonuclease/exonuclease/phosphatase (EEP) superfamily protein YafD
VRSDTCRNVIPWLLVAPLAAWTVVRTFGLERGYPLVPLVSYTPYALLAGIVLVAALIALRHWAALLAAAASVLLLGVAVVPRALPRPSPAQGSTSAPQLRVLSANVLHGSVTPEHIVALVRRERVDLLSIQELTPRLAVLLYRAGLNDLLPHWVLEPRHGARGTGLYARLPLTRLAPIAGSVHVQARATLQLPGGRPVEVVAVHVAPPVPSRVAGWRDDLQALPPANGARLLAGDFNATLDHRELRGLLDRGYRDAAAARGGGWRATWPARRRLPGVAIDHVLVDETWAIDDYDVLSMPASDHRAVLAAVRPG